MPELVYYTRFGTYQIWYIIPHLTYQIWYIVPEFNITDFEAHLHNSPYFMYKSVIYTRSGILYQICNIPDLVYIPEFIYQILKLIYLIRVISCINLV